MIGTVWRFAPDAPLTPGTTYDVELIIGSVFQGTDSFTTDANEDVGAPTAPANVSAQFLESYDPDSSNPLPGNEGQSAWIRTSLSWDPSNDDRAFVYGVTASSFVSPETGQPRHASAAQLEFLLPPDRDVTITVCAIDSAGHSTCEIETIAVPVIDADGGCQCTVAPMSRPPAHALFVLLGVTGWVVRRRRQRE